MFLHTRSMPLCGLVGSHNTEQNNVFEGITRRARYGSVIRLLCAGCKRRLERRICLRKGKDTRESGTDDILKK